MKNRNVIIIYILLLITISCTTNNTNLNPTKMAEEADKRVDSIQKMENKLKVKNHQTGISEFGEPICNNYFLNEKGELLFIKEGIGTEDVTEYYLISNQLIYAIEHSTAGDIKYYIKDRKMYYNIEELEGKKIVFPDSTKTLNLLEQFDKLKGEMKNAKDL